MKPLLQKRSELCEIEISKNLLIIFWHRLLKQYIQSCINTIQDNILNDNNVNIMYSLYIVNKLLFWIWDGVKKVIWYERDIQRLSRGWIEGGAKFTTCLYKAGSPKLCSFGGSKANTCRSVCRPERRARIRAGEQNSWTVWQFFKFVSACCA